MLRDAPAPRGAVGHSVVVRGRTRKPGDYQL